MKKRMVFTALFVCAALLTAQTQDGGGAAAASPDTAANNGMELLPGKALGGRIIPPFSVSVGGGVGIGAGILGFEVTDFVKNNGFDDYSGWALDFPLYGFVDATYGIFETGPVFGVSIWGDDDWRPGTEKPIGWDFSLFGKFPIILNRQFQIFPLVGVRYRLGLKDNITFEDRTSEIPKDYINSLWLLAGVGFDADLSRRVYLRTELLYSDRLASGYGSVLMKEGLNERFFKKIYEVGPEVRVAVGVHLGKLKNIPEITVQDAFNPSLLEAIPGGEFKIPFIPNTARLRDPEKAKEDFAKIAQLMEGHPEYTVIVDGNAMRLLGGDPKEDKVLYKLSRERAFLVSDTLANKYGVPADNLSIFISSGNRPAESNDRVVEVKIVRGKIRGVYTLEKQ